MRFFAEYGCKKNRDTLDLNIQGLEYFWFTFYEREKKFIEKKQINYYFISGLEKINCVLKVWR